MIKNIFLILILSISLYAEAYDIKISYPFESELFDVTQDYNSDIAIVGFSKKFLTKKRPNRAYSDAFSYLASAKKAAEGEQIHMLKLSSLSGSSNYEKRLSLKYFNQAVSLVKSRNHSYFVGGYTQKGELLLLKLTDSKRIKKFKKFGTRNYDKMNRLIALRDGGVLAVGTSMTSRDLKDPMFKQGLGLNDIYLTRFSEEGKMLWSKKFGSEFDDRGISATEAYDGTLLVVGTKDEKQKRSITLLRLSESGDTIWKKNYTKANVSDVNEIITLRDNSYLVAMSFYNKKSQKQIRLLRFDTQYNILATQNIEGDYNQEILSLKEAKNGNIIAVGKIEELNNSNTNALAIYLNPNLKIVWKREYGDKNYDIFRNVAILKDSSFVAVGTSTPLHSEKSDMWIVKLNNDGTIADKKATTSISLYDALCNNFSKEIKAKELEIDQDLTITLTSPLLQFKTAAYKLTPKQKRFLKTFTPKLVKVLKKYQEHIKYISLNGHTSSTWAKASKDSAYLNNMKLSSNRAYQTLRELYNCTQKKDREFLKDLLETHSLASKKRVMKYGKEDMLKSQKVTLKLELK